MRYFLLSIILLTSTILVDAQDYNLSGYIREEATGENLINANIYDTGTLTGTISNEYGFYSLSLTAGKHTIVFSYIGYEKKTIEINIAKDTTINIGLKFNA